MLPFGFRTEFSDKLDKIYLCNECKAAFLFKADAERHAENTGHKDISQLPFE